MTHLTGLSGGPTAPGSSGASSTVAIGSSTPRSARSSSRQTDVSTGGRISARPLSQHSLTGFPNHNTGVPTGLQGEPNSNARRRSLSRGAATAVAVSGEHPVTLEMAKPARPLSTASASTGIAYDDPGGHLETPNVANADEVVPSKYAATPSSSASPPPPPPPPLMNTSHRMLDSADLDQTLVAATGQVYSSAPSRPRFSDSRLPSHDEDDIDVRASNVASTAACLLSQLSGQLQQLNTAGLCTSSQIPADAPADPEFDLPAPPSPKQLHYL
nr:unnamed protein product [Spirometra erinaceieuropaei]